MRIGNTKLNTPLILAPMVGVTDFPFRSLCRRMGANMTMSEMITSDTGLWHTRKSRLRMPQDDDLGPRWVQIAGSHPEQMAAAAHQCVNQGAQIIDINMGCPIKKVCSGFAGSALLKNEQRVEQILNAVVSAVSVPVSLKIRTGWDQKHKNALTIAKIAECAGIQVLTIHGRTRADRFHGQAEYDTIREVKAAVKLPVMANGDIDSPTKAKAVLDYTKADGLLIGRAAQGNPWIFREINHFLKTGELLSKPTLEEKRIIILNHLRLIYDFYGEQLGARIARKHLSWYFKPQHPAFWQAVSQLDVADEQYDLIRTFFENKHWDQSECTSTIGNLAA